MKFSSIVFCACVMFALTHSAFAQGNITVSPWPDKLLYDVGETAKIGVTLTNGGKEPVQGQLTVRVIWEMDDTQTLLQQPVELKAGEKQVVTASWKTAEVLGCEARAELRLDEKTKISGSEYFTVCRAKDMQRVGIHTGYPDLFTYGTKAYLDSIPRTILPLRRSYCNIVEHFSWAADVFADLAPKEEIWFSSYRQNKTAIKTIIAEEHKHGMKSLTYMISTPSHIAGAELLRTHPEWFLYKPDGKPYSTAIVDVQGLDHLRMADLRSPYQNVGMYLLPDFSRKEPLDFGIQQLIASKKMFGWDGVRFDGHFVMWTTTYRDARDNTGRPVPVGKDAEAITRANTVYTKKEVRKVFPDFLFMFNASSQSADMDEICADGGAPANEPLRESAGVNSRWNSWKAFTQQLLDDADRARERGGYPYTYLNLPWNTYPNVDRIQYPLLFATTNHPWFAVPQDTPGLIGGSHYPIQQNLFRFATRFSALLWGHGIQRVKAPEGLITVTPPTGNIWWKDFVYQRPLANGRKQLVIHLINEPPSVGIEAKTQKLPAPISNIMVKYAGKAARAWVASAEPTLNYQQVPLDNGAIKVPELRVWTIVIIETEEK